MTECEPVHLPPFKNGKRIVESKDEPCDPDRFCYSWSAKFIEDRIACLMRGIEGWAEQLTEHDVEVAAVFPYGWLQPDTNQVLALPQDWMRSACMSIEHKACSIHRMRMELHSRRLPN